MPGTLTKGMKPRPRRCGVMPSQRGTGHVTMKSAKQPASKGVDGVAVTLGWRAWLDASREVGRQNARFQRQATGFGAEVVGKPASYRQILMILETQGSRQVSTALWDVCSSHLVAARAGVHNVGATVASVCITGGASEAGVVRTLQCPNRFPSAYYFSLNRLPRCLDVSYILTYLQPAALSRLTKHTIFPLKFDHHSTPWRTQQKRQSSPFLERDRLMPTRP